jgi:hypothetical protein
LEASKTAEKTEKKTAVARGEHSCRHTVERLQHSHFAAFGWLSSQLFSAETQARVSSRDRYIGPHSKNQSSRTE